MMHEEIRAKQLPDGRFVVTVDSASKECANWPEALAIIESEGGMPPAKAHRELFEKCKALEAENAALAEMRDAAEKDRDRYKDWWYKLDEENRRLKEAICKRFVKEYAK